MSLCIIYSVGKRSCEYLRVLTKLRAKDSEKNITIILLKRSLLDDRKVVSVFWFNDENCSLDLYWNATPVQVQYNHDTSRPNGMDQYNYYMQNMHMYILYPVLTLFPYDI